MEVRTLLHVESFEADPQTLFDALMDQAQHAAFTGLEAVIDWREGGRFLTCGEKHFGFTVALVPGRKIVQAWSHRDWPQHHYSIVTFDLDAIDGGTRLVFTQTGVPEDALPWMEEGWRTTYWERLRRWLREEAPAA